jgi:hypothetical protein
MRRVIAAVLAIVLVAFSGMGQAQSCDGMPSACPLHQCAGETGGAPAPCHQSLSGNCCDGKGCLESPCRSGAIAEIAIAKAPAEASSFLSFARAPFLTVLPIARATEWFVAGRPSHQAAIPLFLRFRSFLI